MRKDVREFIRRLEAVGLTVESMPGHYRVLRDGEPLRERMGCLFMLSFFFRHNDDWNTLVYAYPGTDMTRDAYVWRRTQTVLV